MIKCTAFDKKIADFDEKKNVYNMKINWVIVEHCITHINSIIRSQAKRGFKLIKQYI